LVEIFSNEQFHPFIHFIKRWVIYVSQFILPHDHNVIRFSYNSLWIFS